jgi:DNA-binding GntR family transcriptional regulator
VVESLVSVSPRRGTFASEIRVVDLAYICDVRAPLEGYAAHRAAELLGSGDRATLAVLLGGFRVNRAALGPQGLIELDSRVHRFVYQRSRNPHLATTLGCYLNLSQRAWYLVIDRLPSASVLLDELGGVLRAIACGQAEVARRSAIEHIAMFEREVGAAL